MHKINLLLLSFLMSGCAATPKQQAAPTEAATVVTKGGNFIELQTEATLNELIASGKLVIVDFYATWCGPCKRFGPIFEETAAENPSVMFVKVDVDKFPELSKGIKGVPTVKIYKDGKELEVYKGQKTKDAITKRLKELGA